VQFYIIDNQQFANIYQGSGSDSLRLIIQSSGKSGSKVAQNPPDVEWHEG